MKIQEAIVNRVYKTKYNELCIGLKIKAEDYDSGEEAEFREYWQEGTLISLDVEKFQDESELKDKDGYNAKIMGAFGNLVVNSKGELTTKEQTIYQKFKKLCIEYSGESYYQRVKKHLGVEHLREIGLKHKMSESMVDDVFRLQMNFIDNCMQKKSVIDISSLTHKDNAVLKWKQLFEIFNLYNKNEKEV